MSKTLIFKIKESEKELKSIRKTSSPAKQKRIDMLLLLLKGVHPTKENLMISLGVSGQSIQTWRTRYIQGGLAGMLEDNRRSNRIAAITDIAKQKLDKRLSSPKEGFKSYPEVQQWLKDNFDIEINYHAVVKFLRRNFAVKFKVARKSHVNKSTAEEAVFKKPSRSLQTY